MDPYSQKIIANLDRTINDDLSIKNPGSRGLNLSGEKYNNFVNYINVLNNLNEVLKEDLNAIDEILRTTKYITDIQFTEAMLNSIRRFVDSIISNNRNFYIILTTDKIGSEHWILHRFWKELQPIRDNILGFINTNDDGDLNIYDEILYNNNFVIIDDAGYSGINTRRKIHNLLYFWKHQNIEKQDHRSDKRKLQANFEIVIPYMTTYALDRIIDLVNKKNCKVIFYTTIIMESANISEKFKLKYKLYNDPVALYFDHKIANSFGSFPQFYNLLIENPIDRSPIDYIETIYKLDD